MHGTVVKLGSYHLLLHFPVGLGKLFECCLSFGMPSTPPCLVFYSLSGLFLSLATVGVRRLRGLIIS